MNKTNNHHFLPVFYLKYFTQEDGTFYIYDAKRRKFKQQGRKFYPNSHFYEKHANTITLEGLQTDFIETSYSNHDNELAQILRKIHASEAGTLSLTPSEWTFLQYFVGILYWRLPANRATIRSKIANASTLKELGLILKSKDTNEKDNEAMENVILEKLKKDPDSVKLYKSYLAAYTYSEIFNKVNDFAHIQSFPFALPKFISDNPIIYRYPGKQSIHTDDMIIPLTPTQVLFRNNIESMEVHSYVRVYIDMLTLLQADSYIACTDMQYPDMLRKAFETEFKTEEKLRSTLFNSIFPSQ